MWPVVSSGAIKRHYEVDALILLDAYKLPYWLITTLTSYFIPHSESDLIAKGCWTACYCGSLHFRNSQSNKRRRRKCWKLKLEEFWHTIQYAVYIHPYRLWVYHPNLFWERTNKNANLSLGTGMDFCVHLIIKTQNLTVLGDKHQFSPFESPLHGRLLDGQLLSQKLTPVGCTAIYYSLLWAHLIIVTVSMTHFARQMTHSHSTTLKSLHQIV